MIYEISVICSECNNVHHTSVRSDSFTIDCCKHCNNVLNISNNNGVFDLKRCVIVYYSIKETDNTDTHIKDSYNDMFEIKTPLKKLNKYEAIQLYLELHKFIFKSDNE